MRQGRGTGDPESLAALELLFPFEFIVERRLEHSVGQLFASAFGFGQQLREGLLRTQLAASRVDGKSADDRFRHRDCDLPLALAPLDGPVRLFDDDFLQALFMWPRTLIASAFGTAFWIAGSTGRKLWGFWRPAIANLVVGRFG